MGLKKFILNSDNFGLSPDYNRAVLNGYNNGFLKSASITANGAAFDAAVNEILPECQKLSVGVHLNLTAGKPLTYSDCLTDDAGNFKHSFFSLFLNAGKESFLKQIEKEFRAQIEKISGYVKPSHIDSSGDVQMFGQGSSLVPVECGRRLGLSVRVVIVGKFQLDNQLLPCTLPHGNRRPYLEVVVRFHDYLFQGQHISR